MKDQQSERLSVNHMYGEDHDYIGMPCILDTCTPALPYGAYRDSGETFLAILFFQSGKVMKRAGVMPQELTPIDRQTFHGRKIFHEILDSLVNQV